MEASVAATEAVTVAKDAEPRAEQTEVREERLLAVELVAESAEHLVEQLRPANEVVLEEPAEPVERRAEQSEVKGNEARVQVREEVPEAQLARVAVVSPRLGDEDVVVPAAVDLEEPSHCNRVQ